MKPDESRKLDNRHHHSHDREQMMSETDCGTDARPNPAYGGIVSFAENAPVRCLQSLVCARLLGTTFDTVPRRACGGYCEGRKGREKVL
jgi:hypothetical protein